MPQYEFSNDPSLVEQAERLVSLEARVFPTVVVSWESTMLGQEWETILVQDYTIPLPPLEQGSSFNEVRISAFTGEVPTKFLYFGTELTSAAPRVAPEMENAVALARIYQEYRLTADSCPVPYLELISTTPRIYGNGAQDYYSPPIRVERFDATLRPDLLADSFPKIVANLPVVAGDLLTDPSEGFWQGGRFIGPRKLAIVKQGKVLGLRRRVGRSEGKAIVPPEVVRRAPRQDVRDAWVAIDFGASSTSVIVGDGERSEVVPVGLSGKPRIPADLESPSEVGFAELDRVLTAWRERATLPLTEWGDVLIGRAARDARLVGGRDQALRTKASFASLGNVPARIERGESVQVVGLSELERVVTLKKPAPPILDEDGISPDDPFDPIELYGYYIGLYVNTRARGLHLRYAVGMPTGWSAERRTQVLAQLRRGLYRSLPAGMVAFDDLEDLKVVDAGPNVLSFAAHAFKVFGVLPRGEAVPFVSIEAGASETAVLCGALREGTPDEVGRGYQRIVEHVEPLVLSDVAGDAWLHDMAHQVYVASASSMRAHGVPFFPPRGATAVPGCETLLSDTLEAQSNARLLIEAVRPILENPAPAPLPDALSLFDATGAVREVRVLVDRAALVAWLRAEFERAALSIVAAIRRGFEQITRAEPPFQSMRVLFGGRVSLHPQFQERVEALLPPGVKVHKFREPDHTNLHAPTVKLATGHGILALRYQPLQPATVKDDRTAFGWRVGRSKQGKLLSALDESTGYDAWREFGPCTKPEVQVLYVPFDPSTSEVAADAPGVRSISCDVGFDSVGYRLYVRAVGLSHVELSLGPPGGRPDDAAPTWGLELTQGYVVPVSRR
ncbi:MAG: hypothetical protein FJ096_09565 [Deltaproteobacteria bacterium]|nr:hypothetical protein [Deltaproteobacteria bacterium]